MEKLLGVAPQASQSDLIAQLILAADQFIVLPGSRLEENVLARTPGDEVRTVIAGYHRFTDWERDTMISLEGLALCTGRHQEARAILRTFSPYVKDGLLPNLFPEGRRTALHHTADAALWYFHAFDRYLQITRDKETLKFLFPVFRSIVEHHLSGTAFGIGVDHKDGLLRAGTEGSALTWMDAKVSGWVVTPRRGKPVEIQALWYNALCLMAAWAEELGEQPDEWLGSAKQAADSFNGRFWFEPGRHLYDVVDSDGRDDPSLGPNEIFSISLRYSILNEVRRRPVVDVVTEKLLTPFGLRSLTPDHKNYESVYFGDLPARDAALIRNGKGLVDRAFRGCLDEGLRRQGAGARHGARFRDAPS